MKLNAKQIMLIIIAVLGVLSVSSSQLTDLLGPAATKSIIAVANMLNTMLASILAVLSSQNNTVKDVLNMPGIEKVSVNSQASTVLANIAVDPLLDKISPVVGQESTVNDIANGIANGTT